MLPLLPLLVYSSDIQYVIRGSIAENAAPMLPLLPPEIFTKIHQIILHIYLL